MKKNLSLFILLSLLIFAVSCGMSGGGGGDEQLTEKLRVVHAAPTLGKITILQDEKPIVERMLYGTGSEYVELDENSASIFSIKVEPEFVIPILAVEEDVTGPYKKTLMVTESGGQPVFTFIADQTATELPTDESRLRFINAASTSESIDVYVTSPTTSLQNRTPIASKLEFLKASSYFPTTPGDYRIRIAVNTATDTTTTTTATSATAAAATTTDTSSTSSSTPDIDYDSSDYPIDSGEEVSFILLEARGGGRPYRGLTLRAVP